MSFKLFFTLTVASLADVAVLRDQGAQEVDALGRIRTADDVSSTRKVVPEPTKAVTRNQSDITAGAVLSQALLDPFALCMLLLIACYFAFHQLVPAAAQRKDTAQAVPRPSHDFDAVSTTSSASKARSRSSRAPDRFALVVNQKLTRLETTDEVFDFALQSAETGRTDIVNCVTAIHRSAKLMAGKPQFERIRVGQDLRLRKLLAQLQAFLHEGGHAPTILARAVGNTSWALAKLQYRPEPTEQTTILADLQRVFVQHAPEFRPEELMNTVWAFAEMRRDKDCAQGEERVLAVAQAACKCVDKFPEFTLQQVVYLSWALARMSSITSVKHDCSEVRAGLMNFTTKIVERCRPDITRLTTKNLAMLSWAAASLHANLGLVDTEGAVSALLSEIAQHISTKGLGPFLPGEIASIVWALNKVHVHAPAFFNGFQSHLMTNGLRGFSTQDISTILCAFAKTGCGSDALYNMLGERATVMAKDFNRSEKMMVHWAFTQLPHLTPPKL